MKQMLNQNLLLNFSDVPRTAFQRMNQIETIARTPNTVEMKKDDKSKANAL